MLCLNVSAILIYLSFHFNSTLLNKNTAWTNINLFIHFFVLGRYTEIERENRILLEKMSNIMQNPKPNLYNPMRVEKASLNRVQRKNELMKITVENQAILKRL